LARAGSERSRKLNRETQAQLTLSFFSPNTHLKDRSWPNFASARRALVGPKPKFITPENSHLQPTPHTLKP